MLGRNMAFTHFQKKFIKNNIRKLSVNEIAKELRVGEKEILHYLKDQWREDKYNKFIENSSQIKSQSTDTNSSRESSSFEKITIQILLLLTFLITAVYINSLNNVFLSDDFGLSRDKNIGSLAYAFSNPLSFARPLLNYITYHIGGMQPISFRLINIFFHTGNTWLIYIILTYLINKKVALFSALIFAVHPILIESVTWISGGTFSQGAFFFLLSLFFYIRSKNNLKFYLGSIVTYFLATNSSVVTLSLFMIYPLYELTFGNILKNWKKNIPFFVISIIIGLFHFGNIAPRLTTQKTIFYTDPSPHINLFVQIPVAITNYLELIFWPAGLTLYHSELFYTPLTFGIRAVLFVLFLAFVGYMFFKNRIIFFWLSLFLISLAPTLTPFGVSWVVAERYVYLGTLGVIVAFSYVLYLLYKKERFKVPVTVFIVLAVITLGARSIWRNIDWANEDNLWIATAKTSPSSQNTHNNMGDVYFRHKDYPKAIMEFTKAVTINPRYGDAYHNLGNAYYMNGNIQEAINSYKKGLSINPRIWQSYEALAVIYDSQKKYQEAKEVLEKALAVNPAESELYLYLGIVSLQMNDSLKAKEYYEKGLRVNPEDQRIKNALMQLQGAR